MAKKTNPTAKKNPVRNVFKPDRPLVGPKIAAVQKGPKTKPGATKLSDHATGGLKGRTRSKPNAPYGKTA